MLFYVFMDHCMNPDLNLILSKILGEGYINNKSLSSHPKLYPLFYQHFFSIMA